MIQSRVAGLLHNGKTGKVTAAITVMTTSPVTFASSTLPKLPIGIQSFVKLREENFLYVDKTAAIQRLIESGTVFFLSRPRRFGKSLLLSTIEEVFKGSKTLFEGLAIHGQRDWEQKHPVIRIDWTVLGHATPREMESSTRNLFRRIADDHGITLATEYSRDNFAELILALHRKTGAQAVVMVDEYDKPILDVLDKTENAETIRQFLNAFYGVLKGSDEHLRFVFLTGVTKFAGVSVFSGLNNLYDITLHPDFSTICGYTQQELEACFAGHIAGLAHKLGVTTDQLLERARHWYDGYSWDGENFVYNPFSTLRFFGEQRFANYWFTTGTPTFLINTLKKRERAAVVLKPFETEELDMSSYNPDTMGEVPLLFQTGYLTIKKIVRDFDRETFTLCTPNGEVNDSFLRHLLNAYSAYPVDRAGILKRDMERQLLAGDASALEQSLRTMLALVPYPLHIGKEAYYHSLLLVWLRLLGFDIEGEIMTDNGRIDAVLRLPGHIIIAEVKYRGGGGGGGGAGRAGGGRG
ncbi:MAG: AAA family ATPase, partial [Opitutaceae bacterium]|nr:AAA family ATPase [Opitutaceae bacterium]